MNVDLERLVTLQAQDLELKRLREQLADAPKRVSAAEAASKSAAATLQAAKDGLAKEEAIRRRCESDIDDRKSKIARLRKQLDAATNTAQVTAYEHEIKFAEDAIAKSEDDELASMERTEKLEADQTDGKAAVERTAAALEAERARAAEVKTRNDATIATVEAERKTLRTEIASTDEGERALSNYDRVAKSKGTGISEAVDHKCSACQMMVRPQRWNDLTGREHANEIFTCETCGRLLFWDSRRDTPGPWLPGERLAAAKAAGS
ncbi:MAG TPA: C4-type zinc ribbon domain-containing protein [Acidobacteriaceae bacterium]|jgi:hypothetical protein